MISDLADNFEKRLAAERCQPEIWHYVTFADEASFRGAVILRAHGICDVAVHCYRLGINLGVEVCAIPIPDWVLAQVPDSHRNRLLSESEVTDIWPNFYWAEV